MSEQAQYVPLSEISLAKTENKLLTALAKNPVYLSDEIMVDAKRLEHFELAKIKSMLQHNAPVTLGSGRTAGAGITNRGLDYLAYKKQLKHERVINFLMELLLTIISTIGGALLSEPLWEFIRQIFHL